MEHLGPIKADDDAVIRRLAECMDRGNMLQISVTKWCPADGGLSVDVQAVAEALGVVITPSAIPGVAVGKGPGSSWAP